MKKKDWEKSGGRSLVQCHPGMKTKAGEIVVNKGPGQIYVTESLFRFTVEKGRERRGVGLERATSGW